MGSLTSSPDLPPPQPRQPVLRQPVQQPQQQPTSGAGGTTGSASTSEADEQGQTQSQSGEDAGSAAEGEQQRAAALLRERRGRESTINTGFRGILDPRESRPERKTLLGG
jgi:hypothetical protein